LRSRAGEAAAVPEDGKQGENRDRSPAEDRLGIAQVEKAFRRLGKEEETDCLRWGAFAQCGHGFAHRRWGRPLRQNIDPVYFIRGNNRHEMGWLGEDAVRGGLVARCLQRHQSRRFRPDRRANGEGLPRIERGENTLIHKIWLKRVGGLTTKERSRDSVLILIRGGSIW